VSGIWYGAAAYSLWGLFPLYWTLLGAVPALQIMAHRIAWSFVVLAPVSAAVLRRQARAAGAGSWGIVVDTRTLGIYTAAALLIALNWFLYVWGVNNGLVVETSLGYFITPLVNVLLGVVVLRESLRKAQWAAVAVAAAGVAYLSIVYGRVPWIALALAATFGTYGLVKKRAPLQPLLGLTLETGILFVPSLAFLAALEFGGAGAFVHAGVPVTLLLAGAGIVTTIPLLLFATAVQRVALSVIGILQYISPTIQFFLGLFLYREPFDARQLTGFAMVWTALIIFAVDGVSARVAPPVLDEGEF
jgi:chloramphenicol-sensitive protein RarD